MRLSPQQIKVLVQGTRSCFGPTAKIWLFGSRVDDAKKGGDIDIYIETDLENGIVAAKLAMMDFLWDEFEDQKIDILVRMRKDPMTAIQDIAKSTGLELVL